MNCNCNAYEFPHWPNSGRCETETLMLMAKDAGYPMDREQVEAYISDFGNVHEALRMFVREFNLSVPF